MNIENINKLIEHLEYQDFKGKSAKDIEKAKSSKKLIGFNMGSWDTSNVSWRLEDKSPFKCNTTACLGGHIALMNSDDPATKNIGFDTDYIEYGAKYLGISYKKANKLFGCDGKINDRLDDVTVSDAIVALLILRDTGKVSWKHVTRR